jgi:hypothetical protein
VKVFVEGVDITRDVSVNACFHDMYAAEQSDSLYIRFNDTRSLWDTWAPRTGQVISVTEGAADTGRMYIRSIEPEAGKFAIQALSCPPSGSELFNKAWEQVWLHQIITQIAEKHGLTAAFYDVEDYLYTYIGQSMRSDFDFLTSRLVLESCAFLIYDGQLVAYSEPYAESLAPAFTLDVTPETRFEYVNNEEWAYHSIRINCGLYTGTFETPGGQSNRMLLTNVTTDVGSGPEANRFARGLLRHKNKMSRHGVIWSGLLPGIAAGSIVNIRTNGAGSWDGKVFLHHVRHDYVAQTSKLFFRVPLEGY